MGLTQIILFIILQVSMAELAIQFQLSTLAAWVKGIFKLQQPYPGNFVTLSKVYFWNRFFGSWCYLLYPLSLLIVAFFTLHRFISEMVNCPWCASFWMATAVSHFFLNMPLIDSLLLAPFALVAVTILDKLHTW